MCNACCMRNSLNFNKTLPYLTALTTMKPLFFVLFGFQFLRYLLQIFMWFCLVNAPVMLVMDINASNKSLTEPQETFYGWGRVFESKCRLPWLANEEKL